MYLRPAVAVVAALAMLAGCASLTEKTEQSVMVQTVLDHREIAGIGCVLYNDAGKWFVTTPGRVTLRKSAGPLRIDCQRAEKGWAYERVESRADGNLWGNLVLTAGLGVLVDRSTGAGYDYPSTLTVVMHPAQPKEEGPPPAAGVTLF